MQIFLPYTFAFAVAVLAAIDSSHHDLSVREALQLLKSPVIGEDPRFRIRRNDALLDRQQSLAKRIDTADNRLFPRSPISRNDAGQAGRGGQGSGSPARQRPAQGRGDAHGSGRGSSEARNVSPERPRLGGPAGATGSGQVAQGHEASRPHFLQPAPGETLDDWARRFAQSRPGARYQTNFGQGQQVQRPASRQAEPRPPTESQNPGSGPAPPGADAE